MIMKWWHGIYTLVLVMVLVVGLRRFSSCSTVAHSLSRTRNIAVFFFIFILVYAWLTNYTHWLRKISLFLTWIFFIFTIACFYSIDCTHKFCLWITCCTWSSSLGFSDSTCYIFCIACEGLKALVSVIWIGMMKGSIFILLLQISSKVANNSCHLKEFWSLKFLYNILEFGFLNQISKLIEAFCATFNLFYLVLRNLEITQNQSWQRNIVIKRFLSIYSLCMLHIFLGCIYRWYCLQWLRKLRHLWVQKS